MKQAPNWPQKEILVVQIEKLFDEVVEVSYDFLKMHVLPVNTSALRELPLCVQPDVASMHIPLITSFLRD